jgi:hypothetical protein
MEGLQPVWAWLSNLRTYNISSPSLDSRIFQADKQWGRVRAAGKRHCLRHDSHRTDKGFYFRMRSRTTQRPRNGSPCLGSRKCALPVTTVELRRALHSSIRRRARSSGAGNRECGALPTPNQLLLPTTSSCERLEAGVRSERHGPRSNSC